MEFYSKLWIVSLGVFVLSLEGSAYAMENETSPARGKGAIGELLRIPKKRARASQRTEIDEAAILRESHTLDELIFANESENLVFNHPSIVMSAAQRVASWVHYIEPTRVRDPEFGNGYVSYYPVFSAGIPEAEYKRINGQYESIQTFASHVDAAARGDGSANKMLLFVGPAGTGKSYFLGILSALAKNLSATQPDYFVYAYEWVGLRRFPELYSVVNIQEIEGQTFEHPFPCPINETPFNLLPYEYAADLIESRKLVDKVTRLSHSRPVLNRYHCPHCNKIRNVILNTYMQENNLNSLEPEQELQALKPYVRIKRVLVGQGGTMAKLDAEPRDVDFNGLLTSPNAFVLHSFGPQHPMSYYLSGKIPQANGGLIVFDEFFRNDKSLRDQALALIEERRVNRGGAQELQLDALVIGATNNESVREAEKSETAQAHIDRTRRVRMPYLINPYDEAANLLMMKNIKTVKMQKLERDAELLPADKDALFPIPVDSEDRVGPDGRYKVWFDRGPGLEPIHLSPHTLMYIAMVTAGTRLSVDPKKAIEFGERRVIHDTAFRDVYTRLKVLMGQHTLNAADLADLRSLSRDLKEGDFGLSERDAGNVWLTAAIEEAQRPENGNCLTPDLAHKVFLRLLEDGALNYKDDNKVRARWIFIAKDLLNKFLVPALENDVTAALGSGLGAVDSMYDEVFQEIVALSSDSSANEYRAKNGETRQINRKRLGDIERLYVSSENRPFAYPEVVLVHATQSSSTEKRRHPGLKKAIQRYLASRATDLITFDDLQRFSDTQEGSSEVREKMNDVGRVLSHELGYCDKCKKAALMLTSQAKSRTAQAQDAGDSH